jgi:uncharacterized membrane protein
VLEFFFVDFLLDSPFAHVAMGAGLATLCGLRAFVPLALLGLFARYDLLSAPDLHGTGFAFLMNPWIIAIFIALAVLEIVADKLPALGGAQDFIAIPLRMAAGAAVFGASLASEGTVAIIVGMVAGAAIAGAAHAAKSVVRQGATPANTGSSTTFLSLFEDMAAALGTVLVLLLPSLGIVLLALLIFFIYRILRRRRRKYKGLRILRD